MDMSLLGNLEELVGPVFQTKDPRPFGSRNQIPQSQVLDRPATFDPGLHKQGAVKIPTNEEIVVSSRRPRSQPTFPTYKPRPTQPAPRTPRSTCKRSTTVQNSTPGPSHASNPHARCQSKSSHSLPGTSDAQRPKPWDVKDVGSRHRKFAEGATGSGSKELKKGDKDGSKVVQGHLVFDGKFEGGNIAGVKRSEDGGEYEIWLQHDTLNPRYRLWFHFRVSNNVPGQRAILTIVNFSKTRSLYRHGMTPVFRVLHSSDWRRVPVKDVHYYKSPRHNYNHVLSVVLTMHNPGEVLEIAYTFPYNYTRQQYQLAWIERLSKSFLRRDLLCRTPQLRRVDLLTITHPMSRQPLPTTQVHTPSPFWLRSRRLNESTCKPDASRVVFISARVHPGETPASYVTEGLLDFLVSDDKDAAKLREEIVWVVVPMLNPDGCFMGHYRTDAGGVDLNRMWGQSSSSLEPSIYHTLELLKRYYDDMDFSLDVYIDIHAHSNSKTSFLYCNPVPALFANSETLDQVAKLPRLMQNQMSDLCFSPQRWDADPVKAGCARRVAGSMFPKTMCYTLEISFFGCHHQNQSDGGGSSCGATAGENFATTMEGYKEMGRRLALSFLDYYGLRNKKTETPSMGTVLRPDPRWNN